MTAYVLFIVNLNDQLQNGYSAQTKQAPLSTAMLFLEYAKSSKLPVIESVRTIAGSLSWDPPALLFDCRSARSLLVCRGIVVGLVYARVLLFGNILGRPLRTTPESAEINSFHHSQSARSKSCHIDKFPPLLQVALDPDRGGRLAGQSRWRRRRMEVAARGDWRRGRRCGYGGANLGFGSTKEPLYTVGTNRHKDRQSGRGNTRILKEKKNNMH
jgi:hypothetical protein